MRIKLFIVLLMVTLLSASAMAVESSQAQAFAGQDLRLSGTSLTGYQISTGKHVLVFENNFSLSIGANKYSSDKAVVWIDSETEVVKGKSYVDYATTVYLTGKIKIQKGKAAKTIDITEADVEGGKAKVLRFRVSGGIFVTAEKRETTDPRGSEFYKKALEKAEQTKPKPKFIVQREAMVPERVEPQRGFAVVPPDMAGTRQMPAKKGERYIEAGTGPKATAPETSVGGAGGTGFIAGVIAEDKAQKEAAKAAPGPEFNYPFNIQPARPDGLIFEWSRMPDGRYAATVTERFYGWQKRDERGGLLELQADQAVLFARADSNSQDLSSVESIYMSGDIVVTEGTRIIRADEMYYNFVEKSGVAVNAEMRTFDVKRNIPLYVRAARLQQISENKFAAENIVLTSSEFYRPQISATVSRIIITDETSTKAAANGEAPDSSYDARMYGMKMKVGNMTVFGWPYMRSNLQTPDIPLKSIKVGNDSHFGTSVETTWYLSRLLGLKEPNGVDSTLAVDYFGKRGPGAGADIQYQQQDYFGEIKGYIVHDSGEDTLGRMENREDLKPAEELRGLFNWQHRQFLPYNWQFTTGVDYQSDQHVLESYFRREYNTGQHETYAELKRLQDNWAISFLGKARINDFEEVLQELPTAQYHLTGQSLFDDKFTLYNDTQVSRFSQRIGDTDNIVMNQEFYSFISQRTELDLPLRADPFKIMPYVAGTFGFDDRSGFQRSQVDGSLNPGPFGEDEAGIAEAGIRFTSQLWKVYPNVKSRLWDLNKLRHVITPEMTLAGFKENTDFVEQKDSVNIGLTQRLQTKRGPLGDERTVDWMRLKTFFTFVDNSEEAGTSGPDQYLWAKPIIPLQVLSAPDIFNGDLQPNSLHHFETWGPKRNAFQADYAWRVSDTTAILSDMNVDMQSGVVQQFDIGMSRVVWPNLSYYIGSRYLRRVVVLEEEGSNSFTFAATYIIDPRYTLVFSQQYDFDYGANIRSDISLIRKYHRLNYGFTYSVDETLETNAIMVSIWPMGVQELSLGSRSYVNMGGAPGF